MIKYINIHLIIILYELVKVIYEMVHLFVKLNIFFNIFTLMILINL